uniref:SUEL-type lectin domain-containing protein n=1 Tax=Chelonoidis abingdonii TaxID=106734 RepID=A0A8C0GV25_CHEAB
MSELDAGQHPSRRQVEPGLLLNLLYCVFLVGTKEIEALTDFSAEHKTKSACENEELKLHCKESKFLNIYSATYGRSAHEKDICSTEVGHAPQFDCLSYTALEVLSKKCYGKQRCKIIVNNNQFGSPCLPGVKKYLNVSYACVPKIILTAVDPMISNLNPSLKQNNGKYGNFYGLLPSFVFKSKYEICMIKDGHSCIRIIRGGSSKTMC